MNSVLQKYSDRKAILCFHTYTRVAYNSDGGLMTTTASWYRTMWSPKIPTSLRCSTATTARPMKRRSLTTTRIGPYDRTVYQICTDYQSGFEGGSGYIKMLYFDLDNNKIYINSYSPSLDDFNYYDNTSVTELGTEDTRASVAPDTAADGSALPKRINNNINTDILTLDVNFHTDPQTILTSYFGAYLDRGEGDRHGGLHRRAGQQPDRYRRPDLGRPAARHRLHVVRPGHKHPGQHTADCRAAL